MPLDLKSVDLQSSISTATWISSLASSITDNPEISTLSCLLIFVCAIAYQISPTLSPRTQLELLKHNIDSISVLFNTSREDMDFEEGYEIHTRLNRYDCRHWLEACSHTFSGYKLMLANPKYVYSTLKKTTFHGGNIFAP